MSKVIVNTRDGMKEGELIGVFQYSRPVGESIMVGGHSSGVVAYPVAVVKVDDKLTEVPVNSVHYV